MKEIKYIILCPVPTGKKTTSFTKKVSPPSVKKTSMACGAEN
jgi:hypothetical protein